MTFLFANNARTTLAESLTATGTSISLSAGGGAQFPSPETGQMFALFITSASSSSQVEVCYCTGRSTDTLTVKRGMDGTTAQTFSAGDYVTLGPVAGVTALFAQAGDLGRYSASTATDMGGYALNAILADATTPGLYWRSTAANNLTTPGASGASWETLMDGYALLSSWTNSKSTPGYRLSPDGDLEQWGIITLPASGGTTSNVTADFPIQFPTACYGITANAMGPSNSERGSWPSISVNGPPAAGYFGLVGDTLSGNTDGPTVFNQEVKVFWRAKGY